MYSRDSPDTSECQPLEKPKRDKKPNISKDVVKSRVVHRLVPAIPPEPNPSAKRQAPQRHPTPEDHTPTGEYATPQENEPEEPGTHEHIQKQGELLEMVIRDFESKQSLSQNGPTVPTELHVVPTFSMLLENIFHDQGLCLFLTRLQAMLDSTINIVSTRADIWAYSITGCGIKPPPELKNLMSLWKDGQLSGLVSTKGPRSLAQLQEYQYRVDFLNHWDRLEADDNKFEDFISAFGEQYPEFHQQQNKHPKTLGRLFAFALGVEYRSFQQMISRWRLLQILTRHFGHGVLIFVGSSILTMFRQIPGGQSRTTKLQKVNDAVEAIANRAPVLKMLCNTVLDSILVPYKNGDTLKMTDKVKISLVNEVDRMTKELFPAGTRSIGKEVKPFEELQHVQEQAGDVQGTPPSGTAKGKQIQGRGGNEPPAFRLYSVIERTGTLIQRGIEDTAEKQKLLLGIPTKGTANKTGALIELVTAPLRHGIQKRSRNKTKI